jgi:hypothetical protein
MWQWHRPERALLAALRFTIAGGRDENKEEEEERDYEQISGCICHSIHIYSHFNGLVVSVEKLPMRHNRKDVRQG